MGGLWFAWKIVPLWYQQQRVSLSLLRVSRCDLLEKSYLCGINNNEFYHFYRCAHVVICLKNRTFVVSTTTGTCRMSHFMKLWFAWKIVPLWYQQQLYKDDVTLDYGCDLLEKSYLCGINNNINVLTRNKRMLWFAWKIVPLWYQQQLGWRQVFILPSCDLLEKSYLCGINNNKK